MRNDNIAQYSVSATAIVKELASCGITHFVTMPDYVQLSVNYNIALGGLPGVKVVNCATEDEAVSIAFGLHVGGCNPYLSMQNQGLFASANALRSAGRNAGTPIPILAGQWGREFKNLGRNPRDSERLEVRSTEPLLEALEIPYYRLESPKDVGVIRRAFDHAHAESTPVVVLVGAHTSWE